MNIALTQKGWGNIEGLGRIEVLDFYQEDDIKPINVKRCKKTNTTQQTYTIREKLKGEHKRKRDVLLSGKPLIPLMFMPFFPMTAFAEAPISAIQTQVQTVTMHEKMMTAFAPIIELVQSLAYPVALLVVLGGGLFVMVGNSDKGFSMIQRAGLGYVLVMMLPMLLDVLVDAMGSVI